MKHYLVHTKMFYLKFYMHVNAHQYFKLCNYGESWKYS